MARQPARDKLFVGDGVIGTLRGVLQALSGTAAGREARLRISGQSMLPTLPDGSEVVVRQTRRGILPGMLIAYRRGCDLIVHRVIKVMRGPAGRVFVTQGDHNNRPDSPVLEEEVVGRVVAVEPSAAKAEEEET